MHTRQQLGWGDRIIRKRTELDSLAIPETDKFVSYGIINGRKHPVRKW